MYSITKPIYLSDIPNFRDLIAGNAFDSEFTSDILKINKIVSKTEENNQSKSTEYKVIGYNKMELYISFIRSYGLCRSIIVNGNNDVVSFSPPKAIASEDFITKYPLSSDDVIAMEFVEGTMVNVFWDPCVERWEIATRNTVGASSSFYKKDDGTSITFRDMFFEAARVNQVDLNRLNKDNCYSFVLQHPNNRIVIPFKRPELYLVACYTIVNTKDKIAVYTHSMMDVMRYDWSWTNIKFPQIYRAESYAELIQTYASMNTRYDVPGVVLYNMHSGERAKIRNPVYEQVRSLRGNQPKLQYQYLCLRKEGKVGDFLTFYPEHKRDLSTFRDQVHSFTNTLYANYVSCYIKKEKPLIEFSEQYRTHMFHLHQHYMNELKEKNLYINNTQVIQYVNKLHPSQLMYSLNFHMRKRTVDFVTAEAT
jgi:hypothetical protein